MKWIMSAPSVSHLRAAMPQECRIRSTAKGFSLFLLVFTLYLLFFATGFVAGAWWIKLVAGLLTGLAFSVLFVIGHDACHDSLTASGTLNAILARLCFLPSLHPYSTWELGHNRLHHGWTNLKGADYVYTPFSKAEFDALPPLRRALERVYRTATGAGLFYLVEVWWRHLIRPRPEEWAKLDKKVFYWDLALTAGFFLAESAAVWFLDPASSWLMRWSNYALLIVVPFLVWNWLMAFVTLQHHTHPCVAWFGSREEWNFYNGQILGTVHVKLPRVFELLFQNILEHTAHHVDPKIPLYKLPESQRSLEARFKDDITVQNGSIFQFSRSLKRCRLYDYQQHRWLDFDGTPTTESLLTRYEREIKNASPSTPPPRG
jgi:omega-6 fatty acid desaturase (delta-12 desaturase)